MLKNLGPPDFEEYEKRKLLSSKRVLRDTDDLVALCFISILCLLTGWLAIKSESLFDRFGGILLFIFTYVCIRYLPYKTSNEYAFEKMMEIKVYGPTKKDVLSGLVTIDDWEQCQQKMMASQNQIPVQLMFGANEKAGIIRKPVDRTLKDGLVALGSETSSNMKFVHVNNYWLYKGNVWYDDEQLEGDEAQALIEEQLQKRQDKINRAKRLTSSRTPEESSSDRSRQISQDVMDRVWRRDDGKCAKCGSTEAIEFDHIIPFSKGGSNTYRNIQLLCEVCNRSKGNREIG